MSFKAKLSENGTEVIMTYDDADTKAMQLNEYVSLYGTDILKEYHESVKRPIVAPSYSQVQEYYDAILEVIRVNEELEDFVEERSYAVRAIRLYRRDLKNHNPLESPIKNEKIRDVEVEYQVMQLNYGKALELMNYWSRVVGFEPLPSNRSLFPDLDGEISEERLSHLMFSQNYFRENLKLVVEKYSEQGIAVNIYELAEEALNMW